MSCPPVTTGSQFLTATLAHLDCQAQMVGSYGFVALADSGSSAAILFNTLLTLFIAVFAFRLLFGAPTGARDVVGSVLKIGIVMTLAFSWPAYRVLVYDTVLKGPAEISQALTRTGPIDTSRGFAARLQNIDIGIASLTQAGTGRQTGSLELEDRPEGAFRAIALEDETGFAWARVIFLSVTIGSMAALRIAGGLMLALAPLFAGLLLFDFSKGIFVGWVRGLVLVALGSVGVTLLLSIETAILEPWLADAIMRRNLGYATPTAATELLAICAAFGFASVLLIVFLAKVSFQHSSGRRSAMWERPEAQQGSQYISTHSSQRSERSSQLRQNAGLSVQPGRTTYSDRATYRDPVRAIDVLDNSRPTSQPATAPPPLGSSYRRNSRRQMSSQALRDAKS